VPRVLLSNMVLLMAIAVMPAAAWADASNKVDTLLRDYGSISRDLRKAQQAQTELIEQKAILDARGADLTRRQEALNAQTRAQPPTPASQQKTPDENKSPCDIKNYVDGKNTPQHIDGCDNKTKKLKKMSLAAYAGALPLETEQTRLDLAYSQYDEAADGWNAQEQQTIRALNKLYHSMNDWADRAEGLITSAPFQAEILAEHWGKYCPDRSMPSGVLSIDEVVSFADGYAKCLKYIGAQRKPSASHGN